MPRILLGLGALCLLVAALVFLAVAWASLGIEGRTAVLGGFALVAGVLTAWVARRDLRAGAEALSAVTLGLLALVLGGAWRAGWLGTLGDEPFLVVAGAGRRRRGRRDRTLGGDHAGRRRWSVPR